MHKHPNAMENKYMDEGVYPFTSNNHETNTFGMYQT